MACRSDTAILTVNTIAQAEERADPERGDKGGRGHACGVDDDRIKAALHGNRGMNESRNWRAARGAARAPCRRFIRWKSPARPPRMSSPSSRRKAAARNRGEHHRRRRRSGLFKTMVEKAVERQATLDRAIARHLARAGALERLDAVARAILRAGTVELEQRADIPVAVVINEYVEIAKRFFDGPEPGFVNATLDACARDLRGAA